MDKNRIPKYTRIGEIRNMPKQHAIDAITNNVIMACEAFDEIGIKLWSRQLKKYTSQ